MSGQSAEQYISCGVIPYFIGPEGIPIFLLIQHNRTTRHWAFPKGHQEPGETFVQTAKRELREETGITEAEIDESQMYTESYSYHEPSRNVTIHKDVYYFLAKVQKQTITVQAEEILDFAWLPYETARDQITYDNARAILDKVNADLADNQ